MDEDSGLVAQLASGEHITLPFGAVAWQPGAAPAAPAAEPCAPSLPGFARLAHPPDNVTSCVSQWRRGADCDLRVTYALDGNGRVWQWAKTTCALALLGTALTTFLVFGLIYLLLSSLAAVAWLRRRERAGR